MKTQIAVFILLLLVSGVSAQNYDDDTDAIRDYYSLCRGGTQGYVSNWYGVNQDGHPPVDLTRRSLDFHCEGKEVYAPHHGIVWGTTYRFGGLILITDAQNDVCLVLMGMEEIEVKPGDVVQAGDYMGVYRWHGHLAALDTTCTNANWYDFDSRDLERPIALVEFRQVLPAGIAEAQGEPFISRNPSNGFDLIPETITP
ncbi:MAG: hypothetical protein Kow00117_18280 [Phototrophicales bacterium]